MNAHAANPKQEWLALNDEAPAPIFRYYFFRRAASRRELLSKPKRQLTAEAQRIRLFIFAMLDLEECRAEPEQVRVHGV